jgi:hypothetical protein
MSISLRSPSARLAALALGLVVTAGIGAQTFSVTFRDLAHAGMGAATLALDPREDTLVVRTVDPRGTDGVRVDLGRGVTSWSARLRPTLSRDVPFNLTLGAIADGQVISRAFVRETADALEVSAQFTGGTTSTYSAQVYNNGRMVGAVGGLTARARIGLPVDICEAVPEFCEWGPVFQNTVFSECMWRIGSASGVDAEFVLPGGAQLRGDELRLVEEVDPAGHYPYLSFSAITIQTSAPTLTLYSESAR